MAYIYIYVPQYECTQLLWFSHRYAATSSDTLFVLMMTQLEGWGVKFFVLNISVVLKHGIKRY